MYHLLFQIHTVVVLVCQETFSNQVAKRVCPLLCQVHSVTVSYNRNSHHFPLLITLIILHPFLLYNVIDDNENNEEDDEEDDDENNEEEDAEEDEEEEDEDHHANGNVRERGKIINGVLHQKELILIGGLEVQHWVTEAGVRGPPVVPINHPATITPHKNNARRNSQLQMTDRIGELVDAQRSRYEVAPDRIITNAMSQFGASAIGKGLQQGERMKVMRALNDVANSRMYLTGATVRERTAYVTSWLE